LTFKSDGDTFDSNENRRQGFGKEKEVGEDIGAYKENL